MTNVIVLSLPVDLNTPAEELLVFGKPLYRYDLIASTQDTAQEWAERGASAGTVVIARAMTAGRGRRGRVWHTTPDASVNLTAIAPVVPKENLWQVPLVVGVALADALAEIAPELRPALRFPNDLQVFGRKAGGILVETMKKGGQSAIPLIGIGINVRRVDFPQEVADRAISLEEAGASLSLDAVEASVLDHLTRRYSEWERDGIEEILIAYHAYLERDARRTFAVQGKLVPCRVLRVYANGAVLIETEKGERQAFHAAQVVFGDD